MSQAGMYAGIAVGSLALLSICAGILYRKHQDDKMQQRAREQVIQERMQHVADMNLPPFYSDHEQDPVCIYEHELPLDALPPVQPILVHAASEVQIIIPPEDDPLVASPTAIQRSYSGLRIPVESIAEDEPTVTEMEVFSGMETTTTAMETELNQVLDNPASPSSLAGTATPSPRMRPSLALRLTGLSGRSTPTITSSSTSPLGPPVALAGSTSPAIQSPSPAALSSPRIIDRDMLNRARLQLPPSYDVPNRVIGRSPLMVQHLHPTQPDDDDFSLPTACIRDDYFSRVRVRSYTVSNPPQHHPSQFQQHFNQGTGLSTATMAGGHSGSLPETPRYSLEFPSHVPHHQHLEHYQRARALAGMASSPGSLHEQQQYRPWEGDSLTGPQSLRMESRSYSQPYSSSALEQGYGGSSSPSSSLRNGSNNYNSNSRRPVIGMRSRASTLGESSKILVQKMQTLWKKSSSPQLLQQQPQQPQLLQQRQELGLEQQHIEQSPRMTGLGLSLIPTTESLFGDPAVQALTSGTSTFASSSTQVRSTVAPTTLIPPVPTIPPSFSSTRTTLVQDDHEDQEEASGADTVNARTVKNKTTTPQVNLSSLVSSRPSRESVASLSETPPVPVRAPIMAS